MLTSCHKKQKHDFKSIEPISKIVDYVQRRGVNDSAEPFGRELRAERLVAGRFKSGAYTIAFDHFMQGQGKKGFPVPAMNKALGRKMHF